MAARGRRRRSRIDSLGKPNRCLLSRPPGERRSEVKGEVSAPRPTPEDMNGTQRPGTALAR